MKRAIIRIVLAIILLGAFYWWFTAPKWKGRGFSGKEDPWEAPFIVDGILDQNDCKKIISNSDPKFTRSQVLSKDGTDSSRTSETAWLKRDDPLAEKMISKACEITGKTPEHCEDIQVVRYKPGTYYKAHHDSCCEDNNFCRKFESDGGQRIGTLLVYLNDDFSEGHTHFPDHGDLKLKADPGSAIFFRPMCSSDTRCHPRALHAGLPIGEGTKYVCNVWVRENKFRTQK